MDAPAGPRNKAGILFLVLMAQGAIGYVQYFTDLPEILVGTHMLGSTLVWIGVLRVLLALRERPVTEPGGEPLRGRDATGSSQLTAA
ncbi:cytochrome c oxidase assembly protein subunit 15 [Streptomyces sp. SolWspMP-sol7th]|nr:cytochrome c oxidase assembly protein subunit 15 [Streptomyces sp. SolWspMP-sol7th]